MAARALKGLTVIEVSSLVAGPAMGSLLQSLGASVIKIEPPITGDPSRGVSPWGFLNYNFGKKSLCLNLKSPKGQEILHRLVRKADVFLENMGSDVPARLGFSYPVLHKLNPQLIYCSIKGFSKRSRFYSKPAFDAIAQAMSGMMSLTGEPNGEPLRVGNPSVDLGAAAYGGMEVLAALMERQRSQNGRFIEISLLDMSVYWNGYWLTYYGMTGKVPKRLGSGHLGYSPHRVFKTKDGQYFLIATLSDAQWKKLSNVLQISLGESYDSMKYRLEHRLETERAVGNAVAKLDSRELSDKLSESVPCAPVRSIDQVYNDEELYVAGVLRDTRYQDGRTIRIATSPIYNYEGSRKRRRRPFSSPSLGQDSEDVLRSLGYSLQDVKTFRLTGII